MKGRRSWGILLAAALLVLVWRQLSGPKPVGFIGPPPPVKFHPHSDFGAPTIDTRVPILGPVRLPNRRIFRSSASLPMFLAGYFEWQGDPTKLAPRYEVGGSVISAAIVRAGLLKDHEYTDEIEFFEIPFATSEDSREVTLVNGSARWKLRLPVTTEFGPTHRKAIQLKAGRYTVTIRPEPWRLTTAPIILAISSDAPKNVRLLIHLEWINPSGLPGCTTQEKGWLVEGDRITYVLIALTVTTPHAKGMIYELEPVPEAVKKGQPSRPSKIPWSAELGKSPGNGFIAFEHSGRWHSEVSPIVAPATRVALPTMTLADGEELGTAYRFTSQWPYEFTLELPRPRAGRETIDPRLAAKGITGYTRSSAGQLRTD